MARYLDALRWIADNDDTDWLDDPEGPGNHPSVTLTLVADLFDKSIEEATADLQRVMVEKPPERAGTTKRERLELVRKALARIAEQSAGSATTSALAAVHELANKALVILP